MDRPHALRGLLFKEWIKLRLAAWVPFVLLALALFDAFQQMRGLQAAGGGAALWQQVIGRDHVYFGALRYLPALTGLWLAAAQWWPECRDNRLRLLFHLPVHEQRALAVVVGVGIGLLLVFGILMWVATAATTARFLPAEVARLSVLTVVPWWLAGVVAYAATTAMLIERQPLRRMWHGLVGLALVAMLCGASGHGRHLEQLPGFALLAALWLATLPGVLDAARRGPTC